MLLLTSYESQGLDPRSLENGHSSCPFSNCLHLTIPTLLPFLLSHLAFGRQHSGPDYRRILEPLVMTEALVLG